MWKRIFKVFGVFYLPIFLLSLVLFLSQRKEHLRYIAQLQERETINKKNFFIDLFNKPIRSGIYWSQLNYPKDFDPLNKHSRFMEPYIEAINGITDYDQFRILNLDGKEIFRAERKENDSIKLGELQDKSTSTYFNEGINLEQGQLYISQINLNKEYGEIEKPYKPVVRVVGPIYDYNNSKVGVVVINFKMNRILNKLRSNIVENNFYLLDDNQNIITSNTFKNHIPYEISDSIIPLNEKYGLPKKTFKKDSTFIKDNHLWSIQGINLNKPSDTKYFGINPEIEIITSSNWTIVKELPPKFLNRTLMVLYFSVGLFNLLAITLLLILAKFYVKSRIIKEKHLNELEIKNSLLSSKSTELKKTNSKISIINQSLKSRNKQLSEFNYLISHNLRAPVTSMSIIVNMIKNETDPDIVNELIPKLGQISQSINELTEDMSEYVSILDEKKIKIEKVDIEKILDKVKNEFLETLIDSQNFKIDVNLKAWQHIEFSKLYLQSILQNLISNAIKYRQKDTSSFIYFETAFENEKKVLIVKDNGIGIDLEKHGENIFKLYRRFHKNVSGKGIGLFLVKSQLGALNATITVESEKNIGTTFKINFQ